MGQVAAILHDGGLVAYPTDSGYALGCMLGNRSGLERIRAIRQLDARHNFTLVCSEFAQLGQYVQMSNDVFRAIKAATPGGYTFVLTATREAPKIMLQPKRRTVGVRLTPHVTAQAMLHELGEPLMSSTLLLPEHSEPMSDGWLVNDEIGHAVDAVVDSGDCGTEPTTVIDLTGDEVVIVRRGSGDPSRFER